MPFLRRQNSTARLRHVTLTLLALSAIPALAQEQQPKQPPPSAPSEPGLLNEIGKLLKSPADLLPSFSRPDTKPEPVLSPDIVQQPPPPIAPPAATKPPAPANTAVAPPAAPPAPEPPATRLFPGMVSGREVCPRSANGAPDCQAGTDKLCQSKGYKSGKSLNMDSAFTCSPRQARADGRKPCGTEHFVTSAFCQ